MMMKSLIIFHFCTFLAAGQRIDQYSTEIKYEVKKKVILKEYPQAAKAVQFAESECEDMFKEIGHLKSSISFTLQKCMNMGLEQAFQDTLMKMKMSKYERGKKYCQILPKSPRCATIP